ncbi:DUF1385 domain-containing protein [Anaerocolumna sp. MB42-C2]|uniref:DUF1385 domain-containing protein n=1 Tax=Anaerocolumna sp. MB42-C2 TaxID=3070997 RepID=UPI0027E13203|nr:DUF1385 domain-containing protein [Anaerocolumna sp. MB42-C2]WMJ85938.1 DUF1385 domain-containing protein [Anaerocolumna sp. MB42-C2]
MKPSGVGGQAVIEGVMMKNKEQYAVAVRKPNNEIVVEKKTFISAAEKYKLFKLPIFRGMLAFAESMIIGTRTLTFSASFFEEEEEVKPSKMDQAFSRIFKEKAESVIMGITFFIAIVLAVGIFIVLPAFAANLLGDMIESETIIAIVEGIIRILIFIAYIAAISQMKDIKRMFMYHGAEHKTINCLEQGFELTIENVRWQSKQHKRCGTSFMFIVMFVSIIFFIFIRVDQEWLRYLIRILLIPIIAGVSYEFIRFAGKSDSKIVNVLSKPGMWLQGLTTREPDDDMIEVAIQSVEAVFDWRKFLGIDSVSEDKDETHNKKNSGKNHNQNNKTPNNKQNKNLSNNKQNKTVNSNINKKQTEQSNNQNNSQNGGKLDKIEQIEVKSNKDNKKNINTSNSSKKKAISSDDALKQSVEETAVSMQKTSKVPVHPAFEEEEDEILRALDRYLVSKEEEK